MITLKQYLDYKGQFDKDGNYIYKDEIVAYNKALIEKYPWVYPRTWNGEKRQNFDYTYTELDEIPDGWRIAFGEQMCDEIHQSLLKGDFVEEYIILQIKEKFGRLCWYDNYSSEEMGLIMRKYDRLSEKICIMCGKPAEYISTGWISPFCEDCAKDRDKKYVENKTEEEKAELFKHSFVTIEKWFKREE